MEAKKLFLWILIASFLLTGCGSEESVQIPSDPRYRRLSMLSEALATVMYEQYTVLWPGYSFRNRQLLLLDSDVETALLWNDQSRKSKKLTVKPVDYHSLPQDFLWSSYALSTYKGKETLSIRLEPFQGRYDSEVSDPNWYKKIKNFEVILAYVIVVHEGFHFWMQDDIPAEAIENADRTLHYPAEISMYYYRAEVYRYLSQALEAEDPEERERLIDQAFYWYDTWQNEFPEAAQRWKPVDLMEGVPSYVDARAYSMYYRQWDGNRHFCFSRCTCHSELYYIRENPTTPDECYDRVL